MYVARIVVATGKKIEEVRRRLGYSRNDVARAIGVSEQTIYRAERDGKPVARKYLVALSAFFGVSILDLDDEA